jgi:hypothetical protein
MVHSCSIWSYQLLEWSLFDDLSCWVIGRICIDIYLSTSSLGWSHYPAWLGTYHEDNCVSKEHITEDLRVVNDYEKYTRMQLTVKWFKKSIGTSERRLFRADDTLLCVNATVGNIPMAVIVVSVGVVSVGVVVCCRFGNTTWLGQGWTKIKRAFTHIINLLTVGATVGAPV